MDTHQQPGSEEAQEQSAIFTGINEFDQYEYERGIRRARNVLFFIGGLMFVVDMIMLFSQRAQMDDTAFAMLVGFAFVLLAAFIGLGFWTKRKPYAALLTGLILFVAIQVLGVIGDVSNLYKGIILKVVVIVVLVSGIKKARRLEELRRLGAGA